MKIIDNVILIIIIAHFIYSLEIILKTNNCQNCKIKKYKN